MHDSSYALLIKTTWRIVSQDAFVALVKKLNDPHDTRRDTVRDSSHALVITWRIGAYDDSIALIKKLDDLHDKYTRGDTVQDSSYALLTTRRIAAYGASISLIKKTGRLAMHRQLRSPILRRDSMCCDMSSDKILFFVLHMLLTMPLPPPPKKKMQETGEYHFK